MILSPVLLRDLTGLFVNFSPIEVVSWVCRNVPYESLIKSCSHDPLVGLADVLQSFTEGNKRLPNLSLVSIHEDFKSLHGLRKPVLDVERTRVPEKPACGILTPHCRHVSNVDRVSGFRKPNLSLIDVVEEIH